LNETEWKSSLVISDSIAAKRCQGQDKYHLESQSALSKDNPPAMALISRRPYSARLNKRSPEETEHSSNGRKRPGSARPYKLDLESSIIVQSSNNLDVSFPKFKKTVNEQKRFQSEFLFPYKINSEPRKDDTRFYPGLAGFAQSQVNLQVPITRKQRPHSAQISGKISHWPERDESNKLLRVRKRPASAKQPEKNWSLLDGRLLGSIESCARTSYDQLNLNVNARNKIKDFVSAKMKEEDSAQQNSTLRFKMKNQASYVASVEKKVYRHNKYTSLAQALAEGVFDDFDHLNILSKQTKKRNNSAKKVCLDLSSNSLRERKYILDSLRCQQNEHLLGVLEDEQQQETVRQVTLQKIFDSREKVKSC